MKKSHIITLVAVLILIGIYFIARYKQPLAKEIRFFSADSVDIAKLEFFTPEDTIIVEKKGKDWKLTYPMLWDVSADQLNSFFSKVLPIKTSVTPMSEDISMQSVYKVDEKGGMQVKIYSASGKVLDHIFIGNGTNTSYDYGRKQGKREIYQFGDNLVNFVKPDIFAWRSPNITNLKRAQIDRIEVVYLKNSYTLTVFADSIRYTDKHEDFTIPQYNRAQLKVINALENLMTWQFIDQGTEQFAAAFKTPDCRITVHLKDKKTKTFTLIRKVEKKLDAQPNEPQDRVEVLMMIDDKITPLYQMTGDFINRFTRAPMHFKVEYD